jgi:hypothetical protein
MFLYLDNGCRPWCDDCRKDLLFHLPRTRSKQVSESSGESLKAQPAGQAEDVQGEVKGEEEKAL